MKAGVLAKLPQPVLLGQDVPMLPKLVEDKVNACLVLTRSGRQKAEQEEERVSRASQQSGGSSSVLSSEDTEFQRLATGLDDELFQGSGKGRTNRKQRQVAKRMFTLFAGEANRDTQAAESKSSEEGDESSSEGTQVSIDDSVEGLDSDEGEADVPDGECPAIVDTKELKRLQANDPTLSGIREQAGREKGDYFWQNDLLYRRWSPMRSDEMAVNQLVLPVQCRESVLKLAHAIPASGHLGRRKTLSRVQQRFFWP